MSFGDLKQLQEVKALVANAHVESLITALQWQAIKGQLPAAVRELETRIEDDCANLITSGRIAAGLPPLAPRPAVEYPAHVLAHASSFIHAQGCSVSGVMSFQDYTMALKLHASTCGCSNVQPRSSWKDPLLLKIASALLRSLGLSDSISMMEMESLGEIFQCSRCRFRTHAIYNWKSLVRH